jgi:hypothetical protein
MLLCMVHDRLIKLYYHSFAISSFATFIFLNIFSIQRENTSFTFIHCQFDILQNMSTVHTNVTACRQHVLYILIGYLLEVAFH